MSRGAERADRPAAPLRRRKGDVGPAPEQAPEDQLYAQSLFKASPAEATPADKDET